MHKKKQCNVGSYSRVKSTMGLYVQDMALKEKPTNHFFPLSWAYLLCKFQTLPNQYPAGCDKGRDFIACSCISFSFKQHTILSSCDLFFQMKNQKRWNLNFCSALHQSYTKAASKYFKKKVILIELDSLLLMLIMRGFA